MALSNRIIGLYGIIIIIVVVVVMFKFVVTIIDIFVIMEIVVIVAMMPSGYRNDISKNTFAELKVIKWLWKLTGIVWIKDVEALTLLVLDDCRKHSEHHHHYYYDLTEISHKNSCLKKT